MVHNYPFRLLRPLTLLAAAGLVASLAIVLATFGSNVAHAQDATSSAATSSDAVIASTAGPSNATVSQDGHKLSISFSLDNGSGVQPQVRYAVKILDKDGGFVAQKVYDEVLTLHEDEQIDRTVSFDAPSYLSGKYDVVVLAVNNQGLALGLTYAGEVTFTSSEPYVNITNASCYLTVGSDEQHYSLFEGIDAKTGEALVLHCMAKNNFDHAVSLTPSFENHYRSSIGPQVDQAKGTTTVDFAAGEEREFTAEVPLPSDPQAYDSIFSFTDSNGAPASNDILMHYVVHGESATIQSVLFDKDTYSAGETAHVSVFWTGSADSFRGSRNGPSDLGNVKIGLSVTDQNGVRCAAPQTADGTNNALHMDVVMNSDCVGPVAQVSIVDGKGVELTHSTFVAQPSEQKKASSIPQPKTTFPYKTAALTVLLIVLIIILIIMIMRRRSHSSNTPNDNNPSNGGNNMHMPLLLLLMLGAFALPHTSFAGSASGWVFGYSDTYHADRYYSFSIKKYFQPGERMYVSGYGYDGSCGNNTLQLEAKGHARNSSVGSMYEIKNWRGQPYSNSNQYFSNKYVGTAPTTPGTYYAHFAGVAFLCSGTDSQGKCAGTSDYWGKYKIKYIVVNPKPNVSLNANPSLVDYNSSSTLTWTVSNADSCSASDGWSGSKSTSGGTEQTANLTSATTYTLQCTNSYGTSQDTATVDVKLPPVELSISDAPDPTKSGEEYDVTWNSTYAQSCNVGYRQKDAVGGSYGALSAVSTALSGTSTRTDTAPAGVDQMLNWEASCSNSFNPTVTKTTEHTVYGPPKMSLWICDTNGSNCLEEGTKEVGIDTNAKIKWSVDTSKAINGAASVYSCNPVSGTGFVTNGDTSGTDGVNSPAPGVTETYTLACIGDGGTASKKVYLKTHPLPHLDTNDYSVQNGDTVQINWDDGGSDRKSCSITDSNGNTYFSSTTKDLPGDTGHFDATINNTTTFTLSCDNGTHAITIFAKPVIHEQ